jgi:hypothetical protein
VLVGRKKLFAVDVPVIHDAPPIFLVPLWKHLDLESNQDSGTDAQRWSLRRVGHRRVAVVYDPLHHRDVGPTTGFAPALSGLQDRRLAKSSHVGISRSAVIRTLSTRFGIWLLSQENTPVIRAPSSDRARFDYDLSSTFQYASLINFDQLSILEACSE